MLMVVRPSSEVVSLLKQIVDRVSVLRTGIQSLLFTEFGNVAPLHVSLSRPLLFGTWEKDDFLESFTRSIRNMK